MHFLHSCHTSGVLHSLQRCCVKSRYSLAWTLMLLSALIGFMNMCKLYIDLPTDWVCGLGYELFEFSWNMCCEGMQRAGEELLRQAEREE